MSQSLILVDALFLLDGGRRREGEKKKKGEKVAMGEEHFPRAGPALMTVLWFAGVRCN
jgi:hypothetical protein